MGRSQVHLGRPAGKCKAGWDWDVSKGQRGDPRGSALRRPCSKQCPEGTQQEALWGGASPLPGASPGLPARHPLPQWTCCRCWR